MKTKLQSFKQTSSVLRRLNWMIFLVGFSLVLELFGVLLAGNFMVHGISKVHLSNQLFELSAIIDDSLEGAGKTLVRKPTDTVSSEDQRRIFDESYAHASDSLQKALSMTSPYTPLFENLENARQELEGFHDSSLRFFENQLKGPDLLMAQQYQLELNETMKKVQILVKDEGSKSFNLVYRFRYAPLLLVTLITILCVSFTTISGGRVIRRLKISMNNLLDATKIVATGNLTHEALILEHDELGWFTFVFNQMIHKLSEGQDSLNRLYSISTTLSATPEPEQVANAILKEVMNASSANGGMVLQFNSAGELKKIASVGYPKDALKNREYLPDLIRSRESVFVESIQQHHLRWPEVTPLQSTLSYIILPLLVGERVVGGMLVSFDREKTFREEDREFYLSIARQCAQALNRAELYDEAKKAIRLRDDFLSIASHELRTPITPLKLQIQSFLRLIEQGKVSNLSPEQMHKMIHTAETQINRLTKLVDELLDVTRITNGNVVLQREHADVSKVVGEIVSRFRSELSTIKCEVSLQLEPQLMANVDLSRVEQLITNLLSNAMRYGAGKPIEISTSRINGSAIEIRVKDHGLGIAPKDQERIFNRFERAASSTNFGGLGLGLFIVQQIVQQHNGSIRVESALHEGATFIVQLPVQEESLHQPQSELMT